MLRTSVQDKRVDLFQMVPGIGKRTAEKMLVELDAKLDKIPMKGWSAEGSKIAAQQQLEFNVSAHGASQYDAQTMSAIISDVKSALYNLGFKDKDINPVVSKLDLKSSDAPEFSAILRQALVELQTGEYW